MRRLNGVDALMLYLDGGSAYNHTLKISVLDPSTDPDGWSWPKARQMFEERAHLLPVFRLRYLPTPLGLHHPIWVEDPEFDLDAHVRRVVCPAPGGMAEFCALVEQIYAHPLDRDRPLWQTWVVEGLDGGRVALVTLLHHAYSDGVGVLDMLAAFYNDTPDEAPVVAPPWEPPPLPSTRQRLGWALRDLPSRLGKIAPTVRAVRDRVRIEREFAKDGDRRVPPTFDRSAPPGPFQRGLSRSRRFSCESFPLAEVREVSKTLGVTINDVFLACVAGAVRRYLERCGSPPTDAMVATMPLAVTPAAERAHPGNYTTRRSTTSGYAPTSPTRSSGYTRPTSPPRPPSSTSPRPRTPTSARWSSCCRNASSRAWRVPTRAPRAASTPSRTWSCPTCRGRVSRGISAAGASTSGFPPGRSPTAPRST